MGAGRGGEGEVLWDGGGWGGGGRTRIFHHFLLFLHCKDKKVQMAVQPRAHSFALLKKLNNKKLQTT